MLLSYALINLIPRDVDEFFVNYEPPWDVTSV